MPVCRPVGQAPCSRYCARSAAPSGVGRHRRRRNYLGMIVTYHAMVMGGTVYYCGMRSDSRAAQVVALAAEQGGVVTSRQARAVTSVSVQQLKRMVDSGVLE